MQKWEHLVEWGGIYNEECYEHDQIMGKVKQFTQKREQDGWELVQFQLLQIKETNGKPVIFFVWKREKK
ncbi:MAG: hypothetical protein A3C58_02995 [Candidatus Staskawiczbacteria bacterium RIFCSPHIGHO2_02_FULL_34_10]|uniref:DUF4177 domain-containing protein n=2 Tax=Candidatus Staskawicziibacteriota TaxID=1817916 RepID=A0A1G2HIZ4_9BACT|nr:MAG: hypothetical protein A2639_00875 [Candidatus Staskawiczbacteria bacterium RIFCSPHIGHO2_01_FULL_34_27]OGZ67762.1 MAG: hypothetical protein A3C58_02995 [Candidatus Staskawiczbacteria bacterium RIFCSPHIGHO2_02_FULL_34_10]